MFKLTATAFKLYTDLCRTYVTKLELASFLFYPVKVNPELIM